MTASGLQRPLRDPRSARDLLRRAWVSVASIPAFFFLAFAAGEGLYSLFGYDPGFDHAPLWVDLLCGLVALGLFVAPCVAAVVYGRRAHHAGERRAMLPLIIGATIGLYFVVLTVVTMVADALRLSVSSGRSPAAAPFCRSQAGVMTRMGAPATQAATSSTASP